MKHSLAISLPAIFSLVLCSHLAMGQSYPTRPIRLTTVEAGGALDIVVRTIAQGISGPLGQSIVVENRATAYRPEDRFVKSEPNGYSLLYYANTLWLAPYFRADLPYDPLKDFAPVTLTVKGPNLVAVTASLPVTSVAELVALAKSRPGVLNVAVTGAGTSPSLAAILFQSVTGTKMTDVKYKGTGPAFPDVLAGRVEVIFPTIGSSLSFVKSGKLKALAVTSLQRSPLLPDLPSVASLGYPTYESVAIHALVAPARTPPAIINRLNREIVKFLSQPDTREKINNLGFDIIASSPEQLGATIKSEMQRMGKVIRDAGIRPE
jgi:tripartite-type tricarboxylate transporter receptor subunit TctC